MHLIALALSLQDMRARALHKQGGAEDLPLSD